jgi:hypothetical protein
MQAKSGTMVRRMMKLPLTDHPTTDYVRHPVHIDYTGLDVTPARRKCSHSKSREIANAILVLHFYQDVYNQRYDV